MNNEAKAVFSFENESIGAIEPIIMLIAFLGQILMHSLAAFIGQDLVLSNIYELEDSQARPNPTPPSPHPAPARAAFPVADLLLRSRPRRTAPRRAYDHTPVTSNTGEFSRVEGLRVEDWMLPAEA